MFTGIVLERGQIATAARPAGGGRRLRIRHSDALGRRLEPGASLAVAGVCLTVVTQRATEVDVDLAPETLRRTTLGTLRRGAEVNLEPALRLGDALGGHWLQGHVDGVIDVVEVTNLGSHREIRFALPGELSAWVVEKGSVGLDGTSLTVARRDATSFTVALVPHTLAVTTLGALKARSRVNFEADILAKYVQQSVAAWRSTTA